MIAVNTSVHLLFEIAGNQKKLLGVYQTKGKAEYYKEIAEDINDRNVKELMCDASNFIIEEHPVV